MVIFPKLNVKDASIAEFSAALENAGIRDIIAELESQAEAYVAEKQGN